MNFLANACTFICTGRHSLFLRNFVSASFLERPPTYNDLYREWVQRFTKVGVSEPNESAGFIFAHLLGKKTFALIPHADLHKTISHSEISITNDLCRKRLEKMPIQYIIGEWDFFGINLKMKPPVFIPRPETEELAVHVLRLINQLLEDMSVNQIKKSVKVLEVGCGTGAITLSLLNKLKNEPVNFVAIDAAPHAVELTMENLKDLKLINSEKVKVLLHKFEGSYSVIRKMSPFDIIVSNPPYIPTADMQTLSDEIVRYEDHSALHGGTNGLDTINDILYNADDILSDDGSIWFEVDPTHPPMLSRNYPNWKVTTYIDFLGKERFCHFTKK